MPPKNEHMPGTRSKLDSMVPIKEVWKLKILCCARAIILTINAVALPKLALRRPPKVSPVYKASSPVAKDSMTARGMMVRKLTIKTA